MSLPARYVPYRDALRNGELPLRERLAAGYQWVESARRERAEHFCKAVLTLCYREITDRAVIADAELLYDEAWNRAARIRARSLRNRWLGSLAMALGYKHALVGHNISGALDAFGTVRRWGRRPYATNYVNAVRACVLLGVGDAARGRDNPGWFRLAERCFKRGIGQLDPVAQLERIKELHHAVEAMEFVRCIRDKERLERPEESSIFSRCLMTVWRSRESEVGRPPD